MLIDWTKILENSDFLLLLRAAANMVGQAFIKVAGIPFSIGIIL